MKNKKCVVSYNINCEEILKICEIGFKLFKVRRDNNKNMVFVFQKIDETDNPRRITFINDRPVLVVEKERN